MITMKPIKTSLFALAIIAMTSAVVFADSSIFFTGWENGVGTDTTNNTFSCWRTSSIEKPFDGNGDNILGTNSYLAVKVKGVYDTWSYGTTGSQYKKNYYQFDNPDNVTQKTISGLAVSYATLVSKGKFPHHRIGVSYDTLNGEANGMNSMILTLTNSTFSAPVVYTQEIYNHDSIPDMYYFDVLDIPTGTNASLTGTSTSGSVYFGLITFDEVTWAGNVDHSFNLSFSDTGNKNYISPSTPSTTILKQSNDIYSSVVVKTTAGEGQVSALNLSGLEASSAYSIQLADAAGKLQFVNFKSDSSGAAAISTTGYSLAQTPDITSASARETLNVKLASSTSPAAYSGTPSATGIGGLWNVCRGQQYGGSGVENPDFQLVNTEGEGGYSINFTGKAGFYHNGDTLTSDYIFVGADANVDNQIFWTISGLEAGELYEFYAYSAAGSSAYLSVLDFLTNEYDSKTIPANSNQLWSVWADYNGEISGLFGRGVIGENDWSGFQLLHVPGHSLISTGVPEPSSWALLLLSAAGFLFLRKKTTVR